MMSKSQIGCIVLLLSLLFGCASTQLANDEGVSKLYYSNGVLKSVWVTKNSKLNGIKREYNRDGVLQSATNYKDNVMEGMHNLYRADGSLWIKELYHKGKLVSRREFDEEGLVVSQEIFLTE